MKYEDIIFRLLQVRDNKDLPEETRLQYIQDIWDYVDFFNKPLK